MRYGYWYILKRVHSFCLANCFSLVIIISIPIFFFVLYKDLISQRVSWIWHSTPVTLELWGMRSTPSLPLFPGRLWLGVVAPDRVISMGQIELNCVLMLNRIAWNRTVLSFKLRTYAKLNWMLRAILHKSWRQHPTRHQLYGHLPPITKTIQVRRTRHAGHS